MPKVTWTVATVALLAVPAWAWTDYRPYAGGSLVQVHNELSQLERQVRELQREVERLRGARSASRAGEPYPLPGQGTYGLRPAQQGAYTLSLNGSSLRFEADGAVRLQAGGALHLEGTTVVTRERGAEQSGSSVPQSSAHP